MGRRPCCSKEGLNRGAWTVMEDKILADYIKVHGEGKWRNLPSRAGLKRCGKSCRLRWMNYLRPDIKRGNITLEEEDLIIRLHNLLGNRWSLIAGRLPGRTDNEIKNYWNTTIAKRVQPHPSSNPNPNSSKKPRKNPSPVTSTEPGVIRTKASKCTKLFITPYHQPPTSQQLDIINPLPEPSKKIQDFCCGDVEGPEPLDADTSQFISMENNYNQFDFTMDFEMDEKILSDFLNNGTDYATAPFDHDNNDQKEETGTNTSPSSPPVLLSNELSDSDIKSIELLLDAGMDWLQDQ